MISLESMLELSKSDMPEAAKTLNQDELTQLVEWLSLKDDNIRYQAFLLLQSRAAGFEDVYPFWESFRDKLKS
ncbi:MAG: hypothetical protein AAGU32_22245, partial [Bacillota bacterium]